MEGQVFRRYHILFWLDSVTKMLELGLKTPIASLLCSFQFSRKLYSVQEPTLTWSETISGYLEIMAAFIPRLKLRIPSPIRLKTGYLVSSKIFCSESEQEPEQLGRVEQSLITSSANKPASKQAFNRQDRHFFRWPKNDDFNLKNCDFCSTKRLFYASKINKISILKMAIFSRKNGHFFL